MLHRRILWTEVLKSRHGGPSSCARTFCSSHSALARAVNLPPPTTWVPPRLKPSAVPKPVASAAPAHKSSPPTSGTAQSAATARPSPAGSARGLKGSSAVPQTLFPEVEARDRGATIFAQLERYLDVASSDSTELPLEAFRLAGSARWLLAPPAFFADNPALNRLRMESDWPSTSEAVTSRCVDQLEQQVYRVEANPAAAAHWFHCLAVLLGWPAPGTLSRAMDVVVSIYMPQAEGTLPLQVTQGVVPLTPLAADRLRAAATRVLKAWHGAADRMAPAPAPSAFAAATTRASAGGAASSAALPAAGPALAGAVSVAPSEAAQPRPESPAQSQSQSLAHLVSLARCVSWLISEPQTLTRHVLARTLHPAQAQLHDIFLADRTLAAWADAQAMPVYSHLNPSLTAQAATEGTSSSSAGGDAADEYQLRRAASLLAAREAADAALPAEVIAQRALESVEAGLALASIAALAEQAMEPTVRRRDVERVGASIVRWLRAGDGAGARSLHQQLQPGSGRLFAYAFWASKAAGNMGRTLPAVVISLQSVLRAEAQMILANVRAAITASASTVSSASPVSGTPSVSASAGSVSPSGHAASGVSGSSAERALCNLVPSFLAAGHYLSEMKYTDIKDGYLASVLSSAGRLLVNEMLRLEPKPPPTASQSQAEADAEADAEAEVDSDADADTDTSAVRRMNAKSPRSKAPGSDPASVLASSAPKPKRYSARDFLLWRCALKAVGTYQKAFTLTLRAMDGPGDHGQFASGFPSSTRTSNRRESAGLGTSASSSAAAVGSLQENSELEPELELPWRAAEERLRVYVASSEWQLRTSLLVREWNDAATAASSDPDSGAAASTSSSTSSSTSTSAQMPVPMPVPRPVPGSSVASLAALLSSDACLQACRSLFYAMVARRQLLCTFGGVSEEAAAAFSGAALIQLTAGLRRQLFALFHQAGVASAGTELPENTGTDTGSASPTLTLGKLAPGAGYGAGAAALLPSISAHVPARDLRNLVETTVGLYDFYVTAVGDELLDRQLVVGGGVPERQSTEAAQVQASSLTGNDDLSSSSSRQAYTTAPLSALDVTAASDSARVGSGLATGSASAVAALGASSSRSSGRAGARAAAIAAVEAACSSPYTTVFHGDFMPLELSRLALRLTASGRAVNWMGLNTMRSSRFFYKQADEMLPALLQQDKQDADASAGAAGAGAVGVRPAVWGTDASDNRSGVADPSAENSEEAGKHRGEGERKETDAPSSSAGMLSIMEQLQAVEGDTFSRAVCLGAIQEVCSAMALPLPIRHYVEPSLLVKLDFAWPQARIGVAIFRSAMLGHYSLETVAELHARYVGKPWLPDRQLHLGVVAVPSQLLYSIGKSPVLRQRFASSSGASILPEALPHRTSGEWPLPMRLQQRFEAMRRVGWQVIPLCTSFALGDEHEGRPETGDRTVLRAYREGWGPLNSTPAGLHHLRAVGQSFQRIEKPGEAHHQYAQRMKRHFKEQLKAHQLWSMLAAATPR